MTNDRQQGENPAMADPLRTDVLRAALERIAQRWCQHDSEMRDICAACIAQDALGRGKPLVDASGAALSATRPAEDRQPQDRQENLGRVTPEEYRNAPIGGVRMPESDMEDEVAEATEMLREAVAAARGRYEELRDAPVGHVLQIILQPEDRARRIVDQQAEDEGLWFEAQTISEAYLQQELRKLHAAIEGEGAYERS